MITRQPNPSLKSPAAARRRLQELGTSQPDKARQSGFTLIETILIVGIIAVLIGLLLPAVQKVREFTNTKKCGVHLLEIAAAERAFFHDKGRFSSSFDELGLGAEFQCSDPGCSVRQKDGYLYQLVLGRSDQSFEAVGVPAVIGKTGSTRLVADQTGQISTAPIKEARVIHDTMFGNIRQRAIETLFKLILQRPADLSNISRALEGKDALPNVFRQLDANGDGNVTITEILNYSGTGRDVLSDFLGFLGRELELGAGGEDVQALPGVSLDVLKRNPPPQGGDGGPIEVSMLQGNITGLSTAVAPAGGPTAASAAAVQFATFTDLQSAGFGNAKGEPVFYASANTHGGTSLAGFGDGSVRVSGNGGDGQQDLRFSQATFFADLNPNDPAAPRAWAGNFSITDAEGNSVEGILIGLLLPAANPPPQGGPVGSQQGPVSLQAIVIATEGVGLWAGAVGNGHATINWRDGLNSPFRASLQLLPAVQRKDENSNQ